MIPGKPSPRIKLPGTGPKDTPSDEKAESWQKPTKTESSTAPRASFLSPNRNIKHGSAQTYTPLLDESSSVEKSSSEEAPNPPVLLATEAPNESKIGFTEASSTKKSKKQKFSKFTKSLQNITQKKSAAKPALFKWGKNKEIKELRKLHEDLLNKNTEAIKTANYCRLVEVTKNICYFMGIRDPDRLGILHKLMPPEGSQLLRRVYSNKLANEYFKLTLGLESEKIDADAWKAAEISFGSIFVAALEKYTINDTVLPKETQKKCWEILLEHIGAKALNDNFATKLRNSLGKQEFDRTAVQDRVGQYIENCYAKQFAEFMTREKATNETNPYAAACDLVEKFKNDFDHSNAIAVLRPALLVLTETDRQTLVKDLFIEHGLVKALNASMIAKGDLIDAVEFIGGSGYYPDHDAAFVSNLEQLKKAAESLKNWAADTFIAPKN